MTAPPDDATLLPGDEGIVQEATQRWTAIKDWQGVEDERTREDIKFANGDTRNAWQWPTKIYADRTAEGANLPCITINNTRVHNDLIINAICKNGYSIKIRPTGGKASYKSAEVMQSIIRRIENISKFSAAKRKITEQQVDGGIGYCLIETAYVSNKTRDQDIYLKASRDPTGVYLDPWIRESDGSDANFGFVFERMPRKEFGKKYPDYKNKVGSAPVDSAFNDWLNDKEIMLVKYFRKKQVTDTFVWYELEGGEGVEKLASEIKDESGGEIYKKLIEDIREKRILGGTRKVFNDEVEWFLIAGDTIIDRGDWAGRYIPICRCVGRELVVDNMLDRKGMTRSLIDPNRMLNYNASMGIEIVALQPKSPFMAPARAIEGQEQYKTININGYPVILYNDVDDEAPEGLQKIDPPFRLDPPKPSAAHTEGMQVAERWGMMVSGQFQAQMGENDTQSAASGKAINERQQQGDTATYHFPDHQSDMLRFIGVQLLDLIPKIYDTKRTLHILDEDGEKRWIMIDPNQDDVVKELEHEQEDEEAVQLAFNPRIGDYECVSDPGPNYATQRQEAWNAVSLILQQNMQLASVIGDLLFKYGDFPGADKIMERLEKEIKATKPYLFDEKQDPGMVAMQQQLQKLGALNGELVQKLAEMQLRLRGKEELRGIEAHKADTDRLRGLSAAAKDLGDLDVLKPAIRQVLSEMLNYPLGPEQHEIQGAIDIDKHANEMNGSGDGANGGGAEPEQQMPEGARKASDGQHYVPDPNRPGKYMRVVMQ